MNSTFLTVLCLAGGAILGGWLGPRMILDGRATADWEVQPGELLAASVQRETTRGSGHHYLVGSILIAIATAVPQGEAGCRDEDFEPDERDKDIERRGEVVGYMVFSIGTLNALVLAIAEADHFWIGNTIFLSGALASVVSCVFKLVLDKRGF